MGVHVANFMDHGSSKTLAGLVSNTTSLGSTQTTLLEYHMQEWIGHMHALMQDAVERPGLCLFITALVGFIPGPVAGGFHLVCIQSAIWLSSIFTSPMHGQITNTLYRIWCRG